MHYTFPQRCFPKHRFFATKLLQQNTLTNATSPQLKKHKPPEVPKTVVPWMTAWKRLQERVSPLRYSCGNVRIYSINKHFKAYQAKALLLNRLVFKANASLHEKGWKSCYFFNSLIYSNVIRLKVRDLAALINRLTPTQAAVASSCLLGLTSDD